MKTRPVTPPVFHALHPRDRGFSLPLTLLAVVLLAVSAMLLTAFVRAPHQPNARFSTATPIRLPVDAPDSASSPEKQPPGWMAYETPDYSLLMPGTWEIKASGQTDVTFKPGRPGEAGLTIERLASSDYRDQLARLDLLFSDKPSVRAVKLGRAHGTEYFGCAGTEGCINQYLVLIETDKSFYRLEFTPYSPEDEELYLAMIRSLAFKK